MTKLNLKYLWLVLVLLCTSQAVWATTVEEFFTVSPGVTIQVTNDSSYPWTVNGNGELVSTMKVNDKNSTIQFTNQSTNSVSVFFEWKVSSEDKYDFIGWSTNGINYQEISGSMGYGNVNTRLAAGQSLTFRYRKDSGGASGSDCGFIKNLSFKSPFIDSNGSEWCYDIDQNTSAATIFSYSGNDFVLTVPSSVNGYPVEAIGSNVFKNNKNLISITLPTSLKSISSSAFSGCSSLESLTLPFVGTSMNTTGYNALLGSIFGTSSYSGAYAANQYYNDGGNRIGITYYIPSALKNVTVLSGDVKYGAFSGCNSLEHITLSESITSISSYAFNGCSSLTSFSIPSSVTSIGTYAFQNCSSLTDVIIPEGVESIASYTFYGCGKLDNVLIPKSVKTIGNYAFDGTTINSITFGTGLLSIGTNAFSSFSSIIKATWLTNTPPKNYSNANAKVNYVANEQYTSLSNKKVYPFLSSMFTVDGVKYVPVSLSDRTCDAIDCVYSESIDHIAINSSVTYRNVAFKVQNVNDYICYDNDYLCNIELGEGLTALKQYSFYSCNNLQSIIIPNSVSTLGQYCLAGCTSMKSAIIGNSATSIPTYAFNGCTNLDNVKIGTSVNSIGTYAFQNCSSLPALTIPQNVNSINNYAFSGCTNLHDVIIDNRETEISLGSNGSSPLFASCALDSVYIGGKIKYSTTSSYGYSPFYRNTSLRSVVITDTEEQIYTNEFYGCTNLKNVTIGDGVKSIGDWAFSGCVSLDHFAFGSKLQSIGNEAFSDCTGVTEITTRRQTPPTCGTQALDDINKWDCTLRVPAEYVEEYAESDQWKEFLFAEGLSGDVHTVTFNLNGKLFEMNYLTHGSVIIPPTAPVREGYDFAGWKNLPSYMPNENLVIDGSYSINSYKLTYYLDGQVYKESTVEYGTELSAMATPEKAGWYYFSGWNEVPATMPGRDVNVYGTFTAYTLGDVNNDTNISVIDVIGIGNLILNSNTEGLVKAAADVNQDGNISVTDMIYECNVILGNTTIAKPASAHKRAVRSVNSNAHLELNESAIDADGEAELLISLVNPFDEITGLQFDLCLPEGVEVAEFTDEFGDVVSAVTIAGRTSYNNHSVSCAKQESGVIRVLCTSQSLRNFAGTNGELLKIVLKTGDNVLQGAYDINIQNIELAKADNTYIRPTDCSASIMIGDATNVNGIVSAGHNEGNYDLSGRKVTKGTKGFIISNGKKYFVK